MIYKLLPTRVYRAYYGGENIDKLTGVDKPEVSRFPEDWIASVTTAFNPGRDVENEGLSQTYDGVYLKDIIEENKEMMIGNRENMSLLFKLQKMMIYRMYYILYLIGYNFTFTLCFAPSIRIKI